MILDVEMINWRAYERRVFSFKPGLNFILGPNGKGKTSILEAIAYALTGEASVVEERNYLLRNPEQPATVKLTFRIDDRNYRIERTQLPGKAGEAAIYDVETNQRLAFFHKNVTEKVEELAGVSADFLRRIVYMPEGDVFRFLKDPPGKAINQQVQQVLGLTQLDEFQEAIKIAQKRLRDQSKNLKSLQNRIAGLKVASESELDQVFARYDAARSQLMKKQEQLQAEIVRLEEQNKAVCLLGQKIERITNDLQNSPFYSEAAQNLPLDQYYADVQGQVEQESERHAGLEKALSRLEGQKEAAGRVLDLLSTTEEGLLICPVCRKPMTTEEREQAIQDSHHDLDRIAEEGERLRTEVQQASSRNTQAQKYLQDLAVIRNDVLRVQSERINTELTLSEVMEETANQEKSAHQTELEQQLSALRENMFDLEDQRASFVTLQNQLREYGFSNPEDAQEALVRVETRALALDAASQAAEETLADLRAGGLETVNDQIATVWKNFMQYGSWNLHFGTEGSPTLVEQSQREFDFSQFSGGEKTALLVMIHTIIAHHFSRSNFLLVDEPLEHLDPINRRSLMRFFLAAYQNQFFEQALITTYEESLVRKYISTEGVNVIYLL